MQVGTVTVVYALIAMVLSCVLLYVIGIYVYLSAKKEMMGRDLNLIREELVSTDLADWYFNYWEGHFDEMQEHFSEFQRSREYSMRYEELTEEEQAWLENWQIITEEEYAVYALEKVTEADLEKLSDDGKIRYVGDDLYWKVSGYVTEMLKYDYDRIFCVDAHGDHIGKVFFDLDRTEFPDEELVDFDYDLYRYDLHMGEQLEADSRLEAAIGKLLQTPGGAPYFTTDFLIADRERFTALIPIMADGKVRSVLGLSYRWAEFQDRMGLEMIHLSLLQLPGILLSLALLLLFVYYKAIRPLKHVQTSVEDYIEKKDSGAVEQELAQVVQRNEFGALAADITHMVKEIDRYTEENMQMAAEQEKAVADMALAAKIQNGMLRKDFPVTPEYEINAVMDPAKDVGGDFYDFYAVDDTHLALVIGDVSGKGTPASLLMMSAETITRYHTMAGGTPAQILGRVNNDLLKGDFGGMFVTIWLGILDLESGLLTSANAGHEYPMICTGERFELWKDKHGLVCGGMEDVPYVDCTYSLKDGGTIFVYTDGVAEATDADNELFGTQRTLDALNEMPHATAQELVNHIRISVDAFVGAAPQFDDLTILCIRYLPSALRSEKPD
ncbi:MAG: PP2C family protein-serine/threonine phosphatase [Lachnospiraceae bacterium]|nr:PP2C family protein-serine/threonine phosphatase [Lachnospiraceae bacterium]